MGRKARITGRVQGVGFRAWTVAEARRLNLVGWVANHGDGSVLAHFEGSEASLMKMMALLDNGPPFAAVERVDVESCDDLGFDGFEQRPTIR